MTQPTELARALAGEDWARGKLAALCKAVAEYFAEHGIEHLEDCPEDDTCTCPLVQAINDALGPIFSGYEPWTK